MFWKYGSQSIGKVAERIERDLRKLIAAEVAPLRARLDALDSRLEDYARTAWVTRTGGGAAA